MDGWMGGWIDGWMESKKDTERKRQADNLFCNVSVKMLLAAVNRKHQVLGTYVVSHKRRLSGRVTG